MKKKRSTPPKTAHLKPAPTKWQHTPTAPVRVPQAFIEQIQEYALNLDKGAIQSVVSFDSVRRWTLKQCLDFKEFLENLIAQKKEESCDRSIEKAIAFLCSCCDGAKERDDIGFNAFDAEYGKWLNGRTLLKSQAKAALKMLQKYRKQLQQNNIILPEWECVEQQYPVVAKNDFDESSLPEKRIELVGVEIAVYHPYDSTGVFQRRCKELKDYRFDGSDKSWRYSADTVDKVVAHFVGLDFNFSVSDDVEGLKLQIEAEEKVEQLRIEAERHQKAYKSASEIVKLIDAANLDSPLKNGWYLRDYQKKGVEWLLAHRKDGIFEGGILADHMGLGKTITTLVAAKAVKTVFNCPVFVVAPVSLLENWRREAERVGIEIECFSWSKPPLPLESQKYLLIGDESHFIQNIKSQRTQKFLKLAQNKNCIATWLLTGTPIKNGRPVNLYPLLLAVNHPLAANRKEYEKRYCNAGFRSVGKRTIWDNTGAAHLDELSKKTEDVILRRTKQQCLPELPLKQRLFDEVALEGKAKTEYNAKLNACIADYRRRVKKGEVDEGAEALVSLNILRKLGSEYKVPAVIQKTESLLEQHEQIVIFTEFVESAFCIAKHFNVAPLTGDTKDRQQLVDDFQSGKHKVFVGTIKAGGVGLTLTAASNVILCDRPWTPGDAEQSEDRCHRLGQKDSVFAHWVQLGEIDKSIDDLLMQKQSRIELVLKGKRKTLTGISSPKELAKQLLAIL